MKKILEESFRSIRLVLSDLKELGLQGVNLSEENLSSVSQWGRLKSFSDQKELLQKISTCNHCMPSAAARGKFLLPSSEKIRVLFLDAMPDADALAESGTLGGGADALLQKIIHAMGLDPASVHIGHCVACRISEKDFENPLLPCRTFLKNLIALVQPEVLCALGEKTGHFLIRPEEPFSRIRGYFFAFESTPLMVTHHPAELVLDPGLKRNTWEDVKKIMAYLEKNKD